MANRMEWIADEGGLEAVSKATLQEQIYQQLRNRIMSGFFKPGQALSMRSVAEAVGVSVMPVRDALRRLEVENALVVGHNRALEVPKLDAETLLEVSQMRTALEGLAVERAVPAITEADLEQLRVHFTTMSESIVGDDADVYLAGNWAFHNHIYRCAGADLLLSTIESLWLRMGPYFRLTATDHDHLDNAMAIHQDILRALEFGDAAAARAGIAADIEAAASDLKTWLEDHGKNEAAE
ncbi:MAG: GntR family transcriptional regulator [Pseudomonadota bacterium]